VLRPQGLLGRKHLEHVLQRAGLLPEGTALQTAYPAVRTAPGLIACWAAEELLKCDTAHLHEQLHAFVTRML
jgi:hypothetical protein